MKISSNSSTLPHMKVPLPSSLLFFYLLHSLYSITAFSSPAPLTEISGLNIVTQKENKISLQANKASILVFVSAKCPCSASHETVLKDLYKEFSANGFQFIGIHSNMDESPELTQSHFQESAFPFPVIQDTKALLADRLGALKTPHVFILNPAGELLYQGGVDDSHHPASAKKPYLRQALLAIQDEKKPEVERTRSLGCAIKR